MAFCILYLFLTAPWVGLQCVTMALSGHSHLLLIKQKETIMEGSGEKQADIESIW